MIFPFFKNYQKHLIINLHSKNTENKHIVVITSSSRFPLGLAASQRITMIGRALLSTGHKIKVLCLVSWCSDKGVIIPPKGNHYGIAYEYTAGSVMRTSNFLLRQWHKFRGVLIALYRIIQYKKSKTLDCLYVYDRTYNISYLDLMFVIYARLLHVPVIREMNERPWGLKENPTFIERILSPLFGVNGVIVISHFLKSWVEIDNRKRNYKTDIVHIPILTDVKEAAFTDEEKRNNYVLYAASPDYDEAMNFIFDAMDIVWGKDPKCSLYLTGFNQNDESGQLVVEEMRKRHIDDRVLICGYLNRDALLRYYSGARALLIPLFDDIRSVARFPTKIGEYLSSSVPIITSHVGEIPYYFKDGKDAYIAKPNNSADYGRKILECLSNPQQARVIGKRGRALAESIFHFEANAKALENFINQIVN